MKKTTKMNAMQSIAWILTASVMVAVVMTGCASMLGLAPKTLEMYSAEAATFGELNVRWNEVRSTVNYTVLMAETENGNYTEKEKLTGTRTTISELTGNTTYWFKVVAENKKGETVESRPFSATTLNEVAPEKPAITSAAPSNPASIMVRWETKLGEENYKVYISQNTASGFTLAAENRSSSASLIRDLDPNTTYFVRLEAINRFGTSPQSDSVEVVSGKSQAEMDAEAAAAAAARAAEAAARAEREAQERAEREAQQAAERERLAREAPFNNAAVAQLRGTWAGSVTALGQTVNVELRFTSDTEVHYVTSPGPNESVSRRSYTVTGGGTAISIDRNDPMTFTISGGNTMTISGGGTSGISYRGTYTKR